MVGCKWRLRTQCHYQDQDKMIEAAVRDVFLNAHHRFFLWHILKKIPEKIGHICTAHPKFMVEFDEAVYDTVTT